MRTITNKLIELIDDGIISTRTVMMMCLRWMSEKDVAEMCKANDILFEEQADDEE